MNRLAGMTLLMALAILGGCASTGEKMAQKPFPDLDKIDYPEQSHASQGSLYSNGSSFALYGDSKASQVGDIVTIILVESTNASKSASTNTSKDNSLTVTNPTLLGSPFSTRLPGMLPFGGKSVNLDTSLSSSNDFTGAGDSAQSNEMSGTITAVVTKVLPNGNLIVNGKKRITINSGDEYLQISGIIRPRDINGDNTVQSSKLANAEIAYSGTGDVASVNESGWLTRFFNSKWWPF